MSVLASFREWSVVSAWLRIRAQPWNPCHPSNSVSASTCACGTSCKYIHGPIQGFLSAQYQAAPHELYFKSLCQGGENGKQRERKKGVGKRNINIYKIYKEGVWQRPNGLFDSTFSFNYFYYFLDRSQRLWHAAGWSSVPRHPIDEVYICIFYQHLYLWSACIPITNIVIGAFPVLLSQYFSV